MTCRGFVVAGTQSGVGKTSVTVGLLRAFRRRGRSVQPFKVGPDFIDPTHHRAAAGRWSHNLDGWMLDRRANRELVARHTTDADIAVVEGVMGLFDGAAPGEASGSTAEMARWLDLPVVLVVDAWSMAGSVAALVSGFVDFDPAVDLRGLLLNRVAGPGHADLLAEAIEGAVDIEVLGAIPKEEARAIPDRHLGLHMAGEETIPEGFVEAWADVVEAEVDLERLEDDVAQPVAIEAADEPRSAPVATDVASPRIAVARDGAFCFYYRDNLDRLEACGAELVEFAPTTDPLPDGVDGIYIGGGYPEEEAATLAQNTEMLDEIRRASEAGLPIYAECGGLMLLGSWLEDADGERHEMAGIFPWGVTMGERPKMDYVEVTAGEGHPLFPAGTAARGHLFHYGEMVEEPPASVDRTYRLEPVREAPLAEGWCVERTLASWVHLHFGSNPGWAEGFVAAC